MAKKSYGFGNRTVGRIEYLDCMRVAAAFAIVILHCSAQNWGSVPVESFEWQVFNFYDSAVRWGVPVFVMISGALMLDREMKMKDLYKRHVLRMAGTYFFWSFMYALLEGGGILSVIKNTICGHYHMWFIPMIIGLYICTPLIKTIVEKRPLFRYFMILSFVVCFLVPDCFVLVNDFGNEKMIEIATGVKNLSGDLYINMPKGYVFYYVIGYCLKNIKIDMKSRKTIYMIGLLGFAVTVSMSQAASFIAGTGCQNYYNEFTLNVLAESIAVFVLIKSAVNKKRKTCRFIGWASRYCFGAYLTYAFIMDLLKNCFSLSTLSFNAVVSVPILSVTVFAMSIFLSMIIYRIPFLKNFIK